MQPIIDRLSLLSHVANRTKALNEAFGTALTPEQIETMYADEDIELILEWQNRPIAE